MATALEVSITCDLCSARGADVPAQESLRVGMRGRTVSVDLCGPHVAELEHLLEPVIAVGEARVRRPSGPAAFPRLRVGEDREQIRAWALVAGLPVARAGTISGAVLDRWREAHVDGTREVS